MTVQITASFTAEPMERPLRFLLSALGISEETAFSPFNQLVQQLLDPRSAARTTPAMHFFLIRPRDLTSRDPAEGLQAFQDALAQEGASLDGPVQIIFCPHPDDDEADAKREAEAAQAIRELGLGVVGSQTIIESVHGDTIYDDEAHRAGQVPYTDTLYCALAILTARQVHAWSKPSRKLIVVDADQTLWQGILGEDGPDGISVTEPYIQFQEFLLEKRAQGFLLAISSKNDAADVAKVLDEHPEMTLRGEHLVSQRVNWRPKSENLQDLCQDLGLGLESVIFIDDNPAETAEVAASYPTVYTITLPETRNDLRSILDQCWAFDLGAPATDEDKSRSSMYRDQASRSAFRERSDSFLAFLKGLQLRVEVDLAAPEDHGRIAQLSARTNQFNACKAPFHAGELSRRQTEGETVFTVRAADRFGDYGLVGAMLCLPEKDTLTVSAFFLSCRALGKGVERHMVRQLGREAQSHGLEWVRIPFRDAERNGVCRAFFEEIGADFKTEDDAFLLTANSAAELNRFPENEWQPSPPVAAHQNGGTKSPSSANTQTHTQEVEARWGTPSALARHLASQCQSRPDLPEAVVPPASELERRLLDLWESVLGLENLGVEDRFTALGGRSLQLVRVHARLVREFEAEIPLTDLFELPTVRALAKRLEKKRSTSPSAVAVPTQFQEPNEAIAIVGMAIRAPGADSVEAFWDNLKNGVESLHRFSDEELASAGVDPASVRQDPNYVPVKGCMNGIDQFDAAFFGILPKEAKHMDPQHRIFLELAWETLERAGYDPDTYAGKIGVWAGAYLDTYVIANLCTDKAFHADWIPSIQVGSLQTELGNDKDYLATRVSFKLNLRGPSMTVQTACSTSMVAIAQAIQSLRAGESDMALAGGVTITLPEKKGYFYTADGMLAKDGRVCTFSDEATGTVFGNGAGAVLLKRLSDAKQDGDHIHAVIRGAALNNDGGVKHSYTAPSVDGQVEVITMAQRNAGVTADSISYIEAHGTGTPLGDPIEVAALTKCFRAQTERRGFCTLGSLKPNVGHLDVASGVCGVIKTALALEHAQIPPLLHYQRPNPKIDFEESPFRIETQLTQWVRQNGPRRGAVSSFGVGGTNGHVVLEEAPADETRSASARPAQLFLISARTESAREEAANRLSSFAQKTTANIGDAAFTTAIGRRAFAKRRIYVGSHWDDVAKKLAGGRAIQGAPDGRRIAISFMFPGQGAQHVGMARQLYDCEPVFRQHIDTCAEHLLEQIGADLRDVLYPESADETASDRLKQTVFAQPAIFVIETGMAKLWSSWGVNPQSMIGHSVGEFAAACIAGVFTLEDGLDILAARGRLMGNLPGGAMLSVRLSEDAIQPYLDEADLAAVNGKELCVLAGSHEVIGRVEARLTAEGVTVRHLHTSHGFHSRMMDPVIDPFSREIAKAALQKPAIPIYSTVTESWLSDKDAQDPDYWARHLRQPVRFYSSIRALAESEEGQIFIEVGPGQTLATLARQSVERSGNHQFLASSAHANAGTTSDYEQLLETLGRLWIRGAAIDWNAFYSHESPRRVVLPPYPFERKRHWVDAHALKPAATPESETVTTPTPEPFEPVLTQALPSMPTPPNPSVAPRCDLLAGKMREILSELSDIPEEELHGEESFLELGFDSLLLTQVSKAFQDAFSAKVTMRQLIDELPTIDALVAHLDAALDPGIFAAEATSETETATVVPEPSPMPPAPAPMPTPAVAPPPAPAPGVPSAPAVVPNAGLPTGHLIGDVIQQQMELMRQQLGMLQHNPTAATPSPLPSPAAESAPVATATPRNGSAVTTATPLSSKTSGESPPPSSTAHGPYKPLNRHKDKGLTDQQQHFVADLTRRYNAKTQRSMERTQHYRHCFADPRTANGFNRLWKDMCYQIIVERAKGSRLVDIDGNEFIDIVNGFGPGFLGHSPDFVTEALHRQLDKTIAVGPQSELAGETSELICKLVGADRVCFLNTGSEAVQAAMRLARTVTGRDRVAVFSKDYHGNFDEVLVKGANKKGKFKTLPIAPGIPRRAVEDVLVLDYGTEESLEIIRQEANQLAAVMVEPMQSRRPEFQPRKFIQELRRITEETGCLFIFDEVITGFRTGPGGAQEFYGVQADLATYGKVIGGGMPVGLVAGKREYMDTFDGGQWQYGDDSFPAAPVTFFAGTFVRHPLTVAAVNVMAKYFLEQPRSFWETIYQRTERLAGSIDQFFVDEGIGIRMPYFSSQMFVRVSDEEKYGGLLFCQLREKGVFILEGLPCYLTASHSEADVDFVIDAFKESVTDMRAGGFFGGQAGSNGVRLGKLSGPSRQMEAVPQTAPLTTAQEEIWLASHLDAKASCGYNEATTLHMRGRVSTGYLEEGLNRVISRHEALRATFSEDGSEVRFAPVLEIELPVHDLTKLSREEQQARLAAFKEDEASVPFDLATGPLIRGFVVLLDTEESILFLTAHHIVCDGWTYDLLVDELGQFYSARCRGEIATLPPAVSFSRYARSKAATRGRGGPFEYWQNVLQSPPEPLALPTDRPHPTTRTFAGDTARRLVSQEDARAIKRIGAKQKCTASQTFLAVFEILLAKLTGQSDFIIGQPAAGQTLLEDSNLMGHCVNFLPLRANVDQSLTFNEHLTRVRQRVLEAYENQDFTYGEVLPKLDLPRSSGRSPLVEVVLTRDIEIEANDRFHGLQTVFDPSPKRRTNFTMFVNIVDAKNGLVIDCDYQTDILDRETVQRWLDYFEQLMKTLATNAEETLKSISMLESSEEHRLLHEWNETAKNLGPETCLHDLVAGARDKVAVSQGESTLTYEELDERANAIAARLQDLGVGPDALVGIFLDRQPDTVAALLGVLKAGGAYVPLDPGFPKDRLQLMIDDAAPKAVLTTTDLQNRLPETTASVLCLSGERRSEDVTSRVRPEHLAYVIYTSGSTGKPKGVQIEHRTIVNFLRSMAQEPGLDEDAVLLAVTTLCFDISLLELFLPLIQGARLELATREQATNPELLAALIDQCQATHLQATPVTWRLLLEVGWVPPQGFRMLCGGEPMPPDLGQRLADSEGELWNLYGPTETTVWSTLARILPNTGTIHIGRPIANTSIYILDDQLRPVAPGLPGRLFIGGHGLARGYANREELTAQKFIPNPFPSELGDRLYDTGDLARYRADGTLECLGRSDNQIKFNGYRIELGDIESAMRSAPEVDQAAVKLIERNGSQNLAGYVVATPGKTVDLDGLRERLRETLPDYMVPGAFQILQEFPLTPNRKIDRRALPDPEPAVSAVPVPTPHPEKPGSPAASGSPRDVMKTITAIWEELLGQQNLSKQVNFFDAGGHSLLLLRLKNRLQEAFARPTELAELFQHTTIEAQAALLGSPVTAGRTTSVVVTREREDSVEMENEPNHKDIAVIGMSGRFPGASDLETFWENLRQGVESIRDLTDEELLRAGVPLSLVRDPNYVKRGSVIEAAEAFDCQLFGISPREAEFMDLQHRVFLEESFKALEDGGYDSNRYSGRIGLFAGCGAPRGVDPNAVLPSEYFSAMTGGLPDYLTTRVAYRLNLRGPSLTILTACSSSLVALQVAYQNLLLGECEMALAGGISLASTQGAGYLYEDGMMLSPDGRCRALDADAQGTIFTQGAGVVLLKPLAAALEDGDHIRAVVRAAAINNDGAEKIGFSAPAIDGQAAVIEAALAAQDIDPSTIGLVEVHGTGTPLGDPIEMAALTQAYRKHTEDRGYCRLGTLKSNVGHMDAAAGIGSFIKAVLSLEKRTFVPMIHCPQPNSKLHLESSPFVVPQEEASWKQRGKEPRRAAVSSFGVGGTNAHVILEEAPEPTISQSSSRAWQALTFSAKTPEALRATVAAGERGFAERGERTLADIAYTLNTGRREYPHREVRLASPEGLSETLRGEAAKCPVVFLFPGQGTAYHGMARDLYKSESVFRQTVDAGDAILESLLGWKLADKLFGAEAIDWSATDRAQPALFIVEYALARLWLSWGVEPQAMIGHSIGEYVAACVAGVFTLEDALTVVVERGRLMQSMAPGAMLAVAADAEQTAGLLAETGDTACEIAVENSPRSTVVSGSHENIDRFVQLVEENGIASRRLVTSHAFHSAMMEEASAALRDVVDAVERRAPQRPYLSNVTGDWITEEEAMSADYWSRHLRQPVRFSANALKITEALGDVLFLELGPGNALSTFVRQHGNQPRVVNCMRHAKDSHSDEQALVQAVGQFWVHGGALDWEAFHQPGTRQRVSFPGYAMQRREIPNRATATSAPSNQPSATDWTTWLHEVQWKRLHALSVASPDLEKTTTTLLLGESDRLKFDEQWHRTGLDDWLEGLNSVATQGGDSLRIILDLSAEVKPATDATAYEDCQERTLDTVVALARESASREWRNIDLVVVTPGGVELADAAAQGNIHLGGIPGACLSLQQDLPTLRCRVIDLEPSADLTVVNQVVRSNEAKALLAVRGRAVYEPAYLPWSPTDEEGEVSSDLIEGEGAIVITGGFGAIGLAMAEALIQRRDTPVVLVSRLRSTASADRGSTPICEEIPLERLPENLQGSAESWQSQESKVTFFRADVSEAEQVSQLLDAVEAKYGSIGGVIHAAGLVESITLTDYSTEQRRRIHAAKAHGALHLAEALRDRTPRFVLLVSSVSSVLGGVGYSAYASGNAFLDSLAAWEDGRCATRWLTLGLDAVAVTGEAAPHEMTTAQAAELAFYHLASEAVPTRLVVSKTSLEERLERWVHGMAQRQELTLTQSADIPATESPVSTEAVQAIWQDELKLETVGPEDNFFELGGDSIVAIPLFQRLAQAFGVSLPIATLFQAPTPEKLAAEFAERLGSDRHASEDQGETSTTTDETLTPIEETVSAPGRSHGTSVYGHGEEETSPFSRNIIIKMKGGLEGKPPIFFTHPGGGSIVFYHGLLDLMSHAHPMYGIESPLLTQKKLSLEGMESIEAIAQGYTSLIRQIQPAGPYILAGYSFGGLVSLEMGRVLLEDGAEVRLLVFDTPNPRANFHRNKLSERVSYHWDKAGPVSEKLFKMSKRATQGVVTRIQSSVSRASARRMNETEQASKSARVLNFQILELYEKLTEAYAPKPYPGDFHLFAAEDGGDKVVYEDDLGWRDIVQGEFTVTKVPGAHLTLFEEENAPSFVRAVEDCLKKSEVMLHR